jgi:hypothetical protein
MIKIEIQNPEVKTKSGTSARTGKPYSIREQQGFAFTFGRDGKPNPYPVRLAITLGDEQEPYAVGFYTLAPESFYTNRFDQLEISPVLKPVVAETAKDKRAA